jgi:hypothetical protein
MVKCDERALSNKVQGVLRGDPTVCEHYRPAPQYAKPNRARALNSIKQKSMGSCHV